MPASDFRPTVKEVAALERARCVDTLGNSFDTFTDATTPTYDQVTELIVSATDEVAEAVSTDLPKQFMKPARRCATLLSAMNVEMSYYPEQAAANNSMYDKMQKRYDSLLARLEGDYAEFVESADPESATQVLLMDGFPEPHNWDRMQW